jgi:hypothetical protein
MFLFDYNLEHNFSFMHGSYIHPEASDGSMLIYVNCYNFNSMMLKLV